jgi:hypothetical protein
MRASRMTRRPPNLASPEGERTDRPRVSLSIKCADRMEARG